MSYEETLNAKARLEGGKKHSFFEYMALIKKLDLNKYDLELLEGIKTFKDYIAFAQKNLRSLYEHEEELSEITKLQDSLLVLNKINASMELVLLVKKRLKSLTDKKNNLF